MTQFGAGPAATARGYRAAWLDSDLGAMLSHTAPDVVMRPPMVAHDFRFEGHAEVEQAFRMVLGVVQNLHIDDRSSGEQGG